MLFYLKASRLLTAYNHDGDDADGNADVDDGDGHDNGDKHDDVDDDGVQ